VYEFGSVLGKNFVSSVDNQGRVISAKDNICMYLCIMMIHIGYKYCNHA
jgi:hypothetical protein